MIIILLINLRVQTSPGHTSIDTRIAGSYFHVRMQAGKYELLPLYLSAPFDLLYFMLKRNLFAPDRYPASLLYNSLVAFLEGGATSLATGMGPIVRGKTSLTHFVFVALVVLAAPMVIDSLLRLPMLAFDINLREELIRSTTKRAEEYLDSSQNNNTEGEEGNPQAGWAQRSEVDSNLLEAINVARLNRAIEEASMIIRSCVPSNPRTAKRMMNHLAIAMAIAEERGILDNEVRPMHLGKWVGIAEQWPRLAGEMVKNPGLIEEAEMKAAENFSIFENWIHSLVPRTAEVENLASLLCQTPPLTSVILNRLIWFDRFAG
jgi:hypothetical protein